MYLQIEITNKSSISYKRWTVDTTNNGPCLNQANGQFEYIFWTTENNYYSTLDTDYSGGRIFHIKKITSIYEDS